MVHFREHLLRPGRSSSAGIAVQLKDIELWHVSFLLDLLTSKELPVVVKWGVLIIFCFLIKQTVLFEGMCGLLLSI